MSCKVIHRNFHTLPLFEFAQGVRQQIKVKGIRVVEVIVITGSQSLLVLRQDLRIATEWMLKAMLFKLTFVYTSKSKCMI